MTHSVGNKKLQSKLLSRLIWIKTKNIFFSVLQYCRINLLVLFSPGQPRRRNLLSLASSISLAPFSHTVIMTNVTDKTVTDPDFFTHRLSLLHTRIFYRFYPFLLVTGFADLLVAHVAADRALCKFVLSPPWRHWSTTFYTAGGNRCLPLPHIHSFSRM